MREYIDLNCDMGEGFGPYQMGLDEEIIPLISSANVACGFHAGDYNTMNHTVEIAKKYGVHIGAHPGYMDVIGFGRRVINMESNELMNMIIYQLGAIEIFCKKHGVELNHIKLHGALGNLVDIDKRIANYVAEALIAVHPNLPIYIKPNTEMHKVAEKNNLPFILEIYADRAYNHNLTLVSRQIKGSVITDPDKVAARIKKILLEGKVTSFQGDEVRIKGDTICVHSDTPNALQIIKQIRNVLDELQITIGSSR